MKDQTIRIELKPVIFAHHHGYRVVAQSRPLPRWILDKLLNSKHHLYYTERKLDELVKPFKYRFFRLSEDNEDRQEICYVLARLEYRPDIVTHRGAVSAAQFFIIDGEQVRIFENDLHANAAYLMAKIRFLNFDLTQLASGEVVQMPPVTLSFDRQAIEDQIEQLVSDDQIPLLDPLFRSDTIEAFDKGKRIVVYSKRFGDAVEIFNVYCRRFFNALLDCYRQKITFTTSEFTPNISDYQVIFLHSAANPGREVYKGDFMFLSLDEPASSKPILWYLSKPYIANLPVYHRFLSERLVHTSFASVQSMAAYVELMAKLDKQVVISQLANVTSNIKNILQHLDGHKISEDYIHYLETYYKDEYFEESARKLFRSFYQVATAVYANGSWPEPSRHSFIDFTITWIERIIKHMQMVYDPDAPFIALEDLEICHSELRYLIIKKMLADNTGIGCLINDMEIKQPEMALQAWHTIIRICSQELDGQDNLLNKIWRHIKYILESIDPKNEDYISLAGNLENLSRIYCPLYRDTESINDSYFLIFRTLLQKQLFGTFVGFFMQFMQMHGDSEWVTNEAYSMLYDDFFERSDRNSLLKFASGILSLPPGLPNNFVTNCVARLSRLALEKGLHELMDVVRRNYLFGGGSGSVKVAENLFKAVTNLDSVKLHLHHEAQLQLELLSCLGLKKVDNDMPRPLIFLRGYYFTLNLPEFEKYIQGLNFSTGVINEFFANLCGFVPDEEIKGFILPAMWSYLRFAPPDISGVENCFTVMLRYLDDNLLRYLGGGMIDNRVRELVVGAYTFPCRVPQQSKISIKYRDNDQFLSLGKFDPDHIFLQLAAATGQKTSRIEKFVDEFIRKIPHVETRLHVAGVIFKYYVKKRVTNAFAHKHWEMHLKPIIEQRKFF